MQIYKDKLNNRKIKLKASIEEIVPLTINAELEGPVFLDTPLPKKFRFQKSAEVILTSM